MYVCRRKTLDTGAPVEVLEFYQEDLDEVL